MPDSCVRCSKTGEAPAAHRIPFPPEIKEKVLSSVCATCWKEWEGMEIKVINEYRLNFKPPGMIHVEGLSKRYGERVLLEDVSWHVKKRDRIGLTGPNGAGKTTLLKMLGGLEEHDSGSIRMASGTTIGYLPQDGIVHHGRTVYDEVVLAFEELLGLRDEQHRIEEALAEATEEDGGLDKLLARYAEVTERFKGQGGYEIDARIAAVLKGLGFSLADQQRMTEEFSGGWQMRIALAKLLLARPNLLLMDEPTNHLDLPARNWLEEYLGDYPGAVVLVSHDRFFLDTTIKRITEVGLKTLTDYHGNYAADGRD
jgi:ATP-binding cassette subfamily F protein 3